MIQIGLRLYHNPYHKPEFTTAYTDSQKSADLN
jgi:hypothetical protein